MRACGRSLALVLALAGPAAAQFRQDEVGPRDYRYRDDHFISVLSYRPRLTHRWAWAQASDALRRWWWSETAIGYAVTAGSVSNSDLYLQQGAVVRLPLADALSGEYRFQEWEDYDARFQRHEVEMLVRLLRPGPSLTYTLGRTPPEDGLFLGAMGSLAADKEFADVGLVGGWRGEWAGLRLDVIAPDHFFNDKAGLGAHYHRRPITLRAKVGAQLLERDLELTAWWDQDLPLDLRRPAEDDLRYRFRQLAGGGALRWRVGEGVRVDLELSGERTRERRRTGDPSTSDDTDRQALLLLAALELDRAPLLGARSSRTEDVILLGAMAHWLEELTRGLGSAPDARLRRGEGYGEVGYVLGLPSFHEQLGLAARVTTQQGLVRYRDVQEGGRHDADTTWLARVGLALELSFRDDLAVGVIQLTLRADDLTFGGANGQVVLRF